MSARDCLPRLEALFAEYVDSQRANADRPEAHINLGLFFTERREPVQAEGEYRAALVLDPEFVPAYVNLADLYRTYKREAEAEAALNEGLRKSPGNADLFAFARAVARTPGTHGRSIALACAGGEPAPDNSATRTCMASPCTKRPGPGGMAVLERALKRFPNNPELLYALSEYSRECRRFPAGPTPTGSAWRPSRRSAAGQRPMTTGVPLRGRRQVTIMAGRAMHLAVPNGFRPKRKST